MKQNPKGVGILFPKDAHGIFLEVTRTRYSSMTERMKRKKLPPLPFTLEEFRADILSVMQGKEDGAIQCRYCNLYITLPEISVDHATPLSRKGSAGLENLDYPCRPCNNRKGSMTPREFKALLDFLETIPLARIDVLKRLEQSVSLATGARNNASIITELRKTGHWQQAQAVRREKRKQKGSTSAKF